MQMDPIMRARRKALREAQAWLQDRALEMNDPHARQVLNSAAFAFGNEKLRGFDQNKSTGDPPQGATFIEPEPPRRPDAPPHVD